MSSTAKYVRWGILGTARIADTVGKAIEAADGTEIVAVGSRSQEKAAAWADERGIAKSYGSYEAVLDDDDVDAVYIPLPPSMHAEWTIRAAEKGKHVLCEKPLATSVSDTIEMARVCEEAGVQLMDGVMWVHHPRAHQMQQMVRSELGELRKVTSAFTFCREFPLDDLRMQRTMGGGALLDLGWYCVRASLWAFGCMPTRVYGAGNYRNDVDISFNGLMWFDDDRVASFDCGFNAQMRRWLEVAGTEQSLVCDDFTKPWNLDKVRFWTHGLHGKGAEHKSESPIQEVCMIEDFCDIVRSEELDPQWPQAAIDTQRVCEALDRSARDGTAIDLTS